MRSTRSVWVAASACWLIAASCGESDDDLQPNGESSVDGGRDAAGDDTVNPPTGGSSTGGQGNAGEDSGAGQGGEDPSGGAQNNGGQPNLDGGSNDSDASSNDPDASNSGSDAGRIPDTDASDLDAASVDSGTLDAGTLDASDAGNDAGPGTIVFVNWCDGNCNITQGPDSSANNTSTMVTEPETIGPLSENATVRNAALDCFENLLAPFHVTVTETDPGPAEHIEIVAAGTPTALGYSGVSWVAPRTCSLDPDGIGFAFLEVWGSDSVGMCESLGLAFGTLAGLEPSYACNEAMSYLAPCGTKQYTDADLSCGALSAQACLCPRASQNSYQLLLDALGSAP
jgi:hypothetical protein